MEIVRQMLAIGLVLGLLATAVWALGRRGAARPFLRRGSGDGPLEAAARLALSPTHSLHLVRVRGRELLIAVHPGGCALLGPWTAPSRSRLSYRAATVRERSSYFKTTTPVRSAAGDGGKP